jgi:lipopolysaccharide transport system ATP-binding protein
MTPAIVRVRGLAKRYVVGEAPERTNNLREAMTAGLSRRARRLLSGEVRREAERAREFWALSDVSFDVSPGEVLGVVGANGAGKSTLLKILSRITEPTAGRIELGGRVASLLEVGTGFHPELSGRENVYLNGTLLGMRKREIDRKFDEIVAFSEVERFLDTPVKRYSSGMYVRLAFAVAAHLEPEILVVDEVLSVGDAAFQKKCLGKMDDIAHEGRTVLFVSHNMAAVQRLCTRAILLERGRLAFEGEPRAVAARYLAGEDRPRFVAARRSGRPQILAADVQDAAGNPLARLVHTEPWTVDVRYALPEEAPGSRVGIGILSSDGIPLFTTEAGEEGAVLSGEPGEYHARVSVPGGVLLAGDFHLAICLWNEREIFDLQEPALTFAVDPGPSHLYVSNPERKGFVHVACRWSIEHA